MTERWRVDAVPITEHLRPTVSGLCPLAGGVLCPDAWGAVLIAADGAVLWRKPLPDGIFGGAIPVEPAYAAYAGLDNSVHLLDTSGTVVRSTRLPSGINTPLSARRDGTLVFGIGSLVCEVVAVDPHGQIAWRRAVARDDGLSLGAAFVGHSTVVVPTRDALFALDAANGAVRAKYAGHWVSDALGDGDSARVVSSNDHGSALISYTGSALSTEGSVPHAELAALCRGPTGARWAVGTALASASNALNSTWVHVDRPEGAWTLTLPAHRQISVSVDEAGRGWLSLGTLTDDGDSGLVVVLAPSGEEIARWTSSDEAPGPVLILSEGAVAVPTSRGVVGLTLR